MSPTDKPVILYEGRYVATDVDQLKRGQQIRRENDVYELQLKEFFQISNPSLQAGLPEYERRLAEFKKKKLGKESAGNWVYYPWNGNLIHTVTEEEYWKLRTNRNRNLITENEQKALRKFTVGIAGLSIGNGIALSLTYSGLSQTMKLAEHDTLETTNLNRIRAGLGDIGERKIDITSRQIYEINPYARPDVYPDGLKRNSLVSFLSEEPVPRVLIDAIDDFEMKVRLRLEARERGIPVIMLTNLGDSILVDVERYDNDQKLPLFNGLIDKTPEEILEKPVQPEDVQRYAIQIVGVENVPKRAMESVKEITKTLVGRPQLASTVTAGSGIAAYLVRRLALGHKLPSGRKLVKFSEAFVT